MQRSSTRPKVRHAKTFILAAVLAGIVAGAGCGPKSADNPPATNAHPDTPNSFPETSALFTAVPATSTPPATQVDQAILPPTPLDVDVVAKKANSAFPSAAEATNSGLIVCDPVSQSTDLTVFANGCGRWLDLVASGQPELGRTPLWESRARAMQELGIKDFCLSPKLATSLAGITGVNYAACGTISGTVAQCTLTYSLYKVPSGSLVGAPISVAGTEDQVVAALPGLAKTLDSRIGLATPTVPTSVGLTAAELTQTQTLGTQAYRSDTDVVALSILSTRSPLAGMYYMETRAIYDQPLKDGMIKTLLTQLPNNTLAISHVAYDSADSLRPYAATTKALFVQYPSNALLAHTDLWEQRVWGNRDGELKAAQRETADAPGDPETWLSLAYTMAAIGNDLRQGRFAGDLSGAEWATLSGIYAKQEAADLKATSLDPKDGHAWRQLAEAATFSSDQSRMSSAFDKAMKLDPNKAEVYSEGLEYFQPKWAGSPTKLNSIADAASKETWTSSVDAISAFDSLKSAGFTSKANDTLTSYILRERSEIAAHPSNAVSHWDLAAVLAKQGTTDSLSEACLEYRTAEHLMPNSPEIHHWLGDVLDQRHRTHEAIAEYRLALALNPFSATTHFALGYDLKGQRQFPEAIGELRLAMRLEPKNANYHSALGELYVMQHLAKPAVTELQEAIRLSYYSERARILLPGALDGVGEYDASLLAAQQSDLVLQELQQNNPGAEVMLHNTMADDYLHKKEWNESLGETNTVLSFNPNDPVAFENIAEADFGAGRKAQAITEWKRVVAQGNPEVVPVAKKFLAENQ